MHCTIGSYSGGKQWNQGGERVYLLRMEGEYIPRNKCENLSANKIRVEGILPW